MQSFPGVTGMEWQACKDAAEAEHAAATFIAERLVQAVEARGRATLAISGGRSPWTMFGRLAALDVDWNAVHVFQVDERIVPLHHSARNWAHFLESPLARRIPASHAHPMPVDIGDLELAIGRYSATLAEWASVPPQLDVVHLGIGEDGHTASLFTDDTLLQDRRHWVGASRAYEGHRRLTLTLPVLNSACTVVWFAVGAGRRVVLMRLKKGDPEIAASHVQRDRAIVFTDQDLADQGAGATGR
jgi:6-phosphogluconolactonase